MSKEIMEKFAAGLATDPALAEKMGQIQARYMKSFVALAKEAGYDLSEEDFMPKDEQLSEEELVGAAGGQGGDSRYRMTVHWLAPDPKNFCLYRPSSEE